MKTTDPRENGHRYWNLAAVPTRTGAKYTPAATAMARVMARTTGLAAGETVLDIGCGPGTYFRFLRGAVGESGQVVGVDNSPGMLARARARIAEAGWGNVVAEAADATTAELGVERYDVVIAQYSFSAMPDPAAAIRRAHDALRPGGRLFVADVRLVPGGRAAPLIRLLRGTYRKLAGATGQDVLPHLLDTFGSVTHVGSDGLPTDQRVRPWPPLLLLVTTKQP